MKVLYYTSRTLTRDTLSAAAESDTVGPDHTLSQIMIVFVPCT